MEHKKRYPGVFLHGRELELQLFAEEGGAEGGGGSGTAGAAEGGTPASFEDFLKEERNQKEFDRRVQEAVAEAVGKEKEKWKSLTDDRLSEAEKLAKMSEEEKADYMRQKERREFEAEKAEFEKEKLLVEIKKELQEESLPVDFAGALINISGAKKIKEAVAGIKKTWDAQIAEAVKAKARQSTPPEGGHSAGSGMPGDSIMEMAQKNRIIKN